MDLFIYIYFIRAYLSTYVPLSFIFTKYFFMLLSMLSYLSVTFYFPFDLSSQSILSCQFARRGEIVGIGEVEST